ncbi:MAG: hypothetical protein Q9176_007861 [Flavoplaca citrina]
MTLHEDPKSAQIDNSSSTTSHSPVIGGAATKPNMEVKGKSDLSSSSEMSHSHASDGAAKQEVMDVKEKSDHSKCSVCGKDAISVCKAFKGTPDETGNLTAVYYCSAACQKEDWPNHKIKCNAARDRRVLDRARETAQKMWMVLCKKTWSWVIDQVKITERAVLIFDDLESVKTYMGPRWEVFHKRRRPRLKDYFLPFPVDQFPDLHQQEALLNHSRCGHALFLTDDLVKELLKGIDFKITEVDIRVKDPVMMLVHVRPDGTWASMPSQHQVFKITLPNQESLVLDLTGAQFGWHYNGLMARTTFIKERSETIMRIRDCGAMTKENLAEADSHGPHKVTYPGLLGSIKDSINQALSKWQRKNLSFKDMLRCSDEDFQSKQAQLLSFMEECVSKEVAKVNKMLIGVGWRPSMGTHA